MLPAVEPPQVVTPLGYSLVLNPALEGSKGIRNPSSKCLCYSCKKRTYQKTGDGNVRARGLLIFWRIQRFDESKKKNSINFVGTDTM